MEGPSPRIVKETKTIQTDPVPGITFKPDSNNYKHFFIELNGISISIKVPPEHATMVENSKQNYFFLMTIPCPHPKLFSTPKSITPTSVPLPQYRQFRAHLSGYTQKELVSCPPDEVSLTFDPKSAGRTQP